MSYLVDYEKRGKIIPAKHFVLLSQSPRRRQLLSFLSPEIASVEVDERGIEATYMEKLKHFPFLERAARTCCEISKAKSAGKDDKETLYISADTMVVFNDRIYNKPKNQEEAREMFNSYFGHKHHVVTSVCLRTRDAIEVFYTIAEVSFVKYYPALQPVIEDYLSSKSPMDKAGAYGFQDLDPRFIDYVAGDIHTIIGLPVAEVSKRIYS